ncbi:hypothetical protein [Moorena sp. SIO3I6]|nr:hypothetical protein [Moorena sp. SIO3I6]
MSICPPYLSCSLFPVPCSLFPVPCSLFPIYLPTCRFITWAT